jgi:hypothetical protein
VHELFLSGGQWRDADLTAITGGPTAYPYSLAIAYDPVWNGMRTDYIANGTFESEVHELFLAGGQWRDASLTAITGGPTDISPYSLAIAYDPFWNVMRTHYVAAYGFLHINHVHELFLSGGQWWDVDLTAMTGGPIPYSYGVAMAFDPVWLGMRTHYISLGRGDVHELFLAVQL